MLVLSRREQEAILIGDDIKITIIEIRNNHQVRIAIEAPTNIRILREELLDRPNHGLKDKTTQAD